MALDQLDAPLRITWDLCPQGRGALSEAELLTVAARLVDAGIFYLLLDERPLLHPALTQLLNQMQSGGCQLSLIIGDQAEELDNLAGLEPNFNLWVDAGPWLAKTEGLKALESFIVQLKSCGQRVSMLWLPTAGNLQLIFALLEICVRQNLPRFKLPNTKIGASPEPFSTAGFLQQEDLQGLAQALKLRPLNPGKTALEVHDLFLWELLFPNGGGERSEYGGCQAGNSLGHIAADGALWPCSSWPQPLGNLLREDLESIWASETRQQVRAEVAEAPGDCSGCHDYQICYGGCRGLARSCRRDGNRRDLLCAGPRKSSH